MLQSKQQTINFSISLARLEYSLTTSSIEFIAAILVNKIFQISFPKYGKWCGFVTKQQLSAVLRESEIASIRRRDVRTVNLCIYSF
jgi:hypothetical protein